MVLNSLDSFSRIQLYDLPSNPSRIDRIILAQLRSYTRVETFCRKMNQLRGRKVAPVNVDDVLGAWLDAILKLQVKYVEATVAQLLE